MRSRYVWVVKGFTGAIIAGFTVKRELAHWLEDMGQAVYPVRIDCRTQTVVPLDRNTLEPTDE